MVWCHFLHVSFDCNLLSFLILWVYTFYQLQKLFTIVFQNLLFYSLCFSSSLKTSIRPIIVQFSSVQSHSHVWLFVTPWTAAQQASLSITNTHNLLKLISIELVMLSNHLILCHPFSCPQSFPASGSFQMGQFFASGGQSIGVSDSASVFPMNI